ncbi:MAG: hypothetical protein AABY07_06560 [Nanoarchaeota archaeon]
MGGKYLQKSIVFIFLVLLIPSSFAAFSVKIGDGNIKVVLRPEVDEGETKVIGRTLSVINENDFPIHVKLVPSESIKDIIELIDGELDLAADEEKKARFNVILKDQHTYSGIINVFFSSEEADAGIVLSSVIDVIGEKGPKPGNDQEVEAEEEIDEQENTVDVSFGSPHSDGKTSWFAGKTISYSPSFSLGFTILFVFILIAIGGFIFLLSR